MYEFKVKWCPVCSQGWVQIFKEEHSGELYLCCDECESEWATPLNICPASAKAGVHGKSSDPTWDEVRLAGWNCYVMKG